MKKEKSIKITLSRRKKGEVVEKKTHKKVVDIQS